jgi:hypothetical protein
MNTPNISIYIRRAEINQSESYIKSVIENNYGLVSTIEFKNKKNEQGMEYNGVVIYFKQWFNNDKVKQLFNDLNNTTEKISKIIHNSKSNKYWIVNVHTTPSIANLNNLTILNIEHLSQSEQIIELTNIVHSISSQLQFLQTKCENNEKILQQTLHDNTLYHMKNDDLAWEIEQKNDEILELNNKNK